MALTARQRRRLRPQSRRNVLESRRTYIQSGRARTTSRGVCAYTYPNENTHGNIAGPGADFSLSLGASCGRWRRGPSPIAPHMLPHPTNAAPRNRRVYIIGIWTRERAHARPAPRGFEFKRAPPPHSCYRGGRFLSLDFPQILVYIVRLRACPKRPVCPRIRRIEGLTEPN